MPPKILSKNVLGMKFMQRTKEKLDEKKEVAETTGQILDTEEAQIEVWQTEDSIANCEQLGFGRMSFRGYNPEIERLMQEKNPVKYGKKTQERRDEEDITAEEMAQRYQGNDERSGQVKRKRGQYIRPVDQD